MKYEVGDLVAYQPLIGSPVLGRVTAAFNDVVGWTVTFIVTSRAHPLYQVGTELAVPLDSNGLKKRKRYRHGK